MLVWNFPTTQLRAVWGTVSFGRDSSEMARIAMARDICPLSASPDKHTCKQCHKQVLESWDCSETASPDSMKRMPTRAVAVRSSLSAVRRAMTKNHLIWQGRLPSDLLESVLKDVEIVLLPWKNFATKLEHFNNSLSKTLKSLIRHPNEVENIIISVFNRDHDEIRQVVLRWRKFSGYDLLQELFALASVQIDEEGSRVNLNNNQRLWLVRMTIYGALMTS